MGEMKKTKIIKKLKWRQKFSKSIWDKKLKAMKTEIIKWNIRHHTTQSQHSLNSNVHLFKVNKKYKVNDDGHCFDISSVDLERLEKLN